MAAFKKKNFPHKKIVKNALQVEQFSTYRKNPTTSVGYLVLQIPLKFQVDRIKINCSSSTASRGGKWNFQKNAFKSFAYLPAL